MSRDVDPEFDPNERLWRRIEKRAVNPAGALKPSAFRLQVSIVRERHGKREDAPEGKWNGVAESTAGVVAGILFGKARVACVDEPLKTPKGEGHALVAVVATPGDKLPEDVTNAARSAFAKAFKVVVSPT